MNRFGAACLGLTMPCLGALAVAAQDRLPDGQVANGSGGGAIQAWYVYPTARYDHGILGDAIEAAGLIVVDDRGQRFEIDLPENQVFEDLTPRLADLDGDGGNEVITIRTDIASGAAVAVYGVQAGQLVEVAATRPIGQSHRWLSIAAIADFTGNGVPEVVVVKTPHIGGRLEVLSLRRGQLRSLYPAASGYSTHFIGSRDISLAGVGEVTGEGRLELVVPDQTRRRVVVLNLADWVSEVLSFDLPGAVVAPIMVDASGTIVVPTDAGSISIDID